MTIPWSNAMAATNPAFANTQVCSGVFCWIRGVMVWSFHRALMGYGYLVYNAVRLTPSALKLQITDDGTVTRVYITATVETWRTFDQTTDVDTFAGCGEN